MEQGRRRRDECESRVEDRRGRDRLVDGAYEHEQSEQLGAGTVARVRDRAAVMRRAALVKRARITLFRGNGCGFFMTRRRLLLCGRFGCMRNAALLRHERRQRRHLAEQPGKRHRAYATPDCDHVPSG